MRFTHRVLTVALLSGAAALSLSTLDAEAQGRRGAMPEFSAIDADGDGAITQAEMEAFRAARLAEMDADGDGRVTNAERGAARDAAIAERFAAADADGNGSLSAEELASMGSERAAERATRLIERADTDGDGALSAEELADARPDRGRGGGKGDGRRGGGRDGGGRDGAAFERLDADGDGRVTESEWTDRGARR